jgi:CBS domain-containing protein
VGPDSDLKEIATLMVERHITILPVVKGSELVGTITKPDVLQAAFRFPSDS